MSLHSHSSDINSNLCDLTVLCPLPWVKKAMPLNDKDNVPGSAANTCFLPSCLVIHSLHSNRDFAMVCNVMVIKNYLLLQSHSSVGVTPSSPPNKRQDRENGLEKERKPRSHFNNECPQNTYPGWVSSLPPFHRPHPPGTYASCLHWKVMLFSYSPSFF